jgi:hypothetical protein
MARSQVEVSVEFARALLARAEEISSMTEEGDGSKRSELRLARGWELAELVFKLAGVASVNGREWLPSPKLLGKAVALSSAAALASNLALADQFAEAAVLVADGSSVGLRIPKEQRAIDTTDFMRAAFLAMAAGDERAQQALRAATDGVADEALRSLVPAREAVRGLLRQLLGAKTTPLTSDELAVTLAATPEYFRSRVEELLLPVVNALGAADKQAAFQTVLAKHEAHYAASDRREDLRGLVAWGALALAGVWQTRPTEPSDYLAEVIMEAFAKPVASLPLSLECPPLRARTMLEAKTRMEFSFNGAVEVHPQSEEKVFELRVGQLVVGRFTIEDPSDEQSFGRGSDSLLDAGELVVLAEQAVARARAGGDATRELGLARAAANRARDLLGDAATELYRNQMTSPLGRAQCDQRPTLFSHAGLIDFRDRIAAES